MAEKVAGAELVVAIVDDPAIHEVNREHLQHDYPTDVISFLYDSEVRQASDHSELRGCGLHLDGELVVSAETAIREAERLGWDSESELSLYIVHGLLHLCGYDDLTDHEKLIMRKREREVLQHWGLSPHYPEDACDESILLNKE